MRLIDDEGTQVGVVSLRDAINAARERGLDLVEVPCIYKSFVIK